MAMNKNIKVFVIFLLVLVIMNFATGLLASYGLSDALLPSLPIIGFLPVFGALILFILWKFWLRKEL